MYASNARLMQKQLRLWSAGKHLADLRPAAAIRPSAGGGSGAPADGALLDENLYPLNMHLLDKIAVQLLLSRDQVMFTRSG
jgi:hypothetical protein